MTVKVTLTKITGVHRPTTGQPLNQIQTSRNKNLDITKTVTELGLNPDSDIIFIGSDEVAVEKWGPNTPPYNETDKSIIVLKTTDKADFLIEHVLVVTGISNKKRNRGQLITINLKVTVR